LKLNPVHSRKKINPDSDDVILDKVRQSAKEDN
jgi:hypothetical protein